MAVLRWVGLVAGLVLVGGALGQTVEEAGVRVRFVGDGFAVELPVRGAAGTVQASAELLGVEGSVYSRGAAACGLVGVSTVCRVPLPPASGVNATHGQDDADLAHLRVRYLVCAAAGACARGVLALDHVAPELFMLLQAGPRTIRPGGTYSLRIRATQPLTGVGQAGVALRVGASAGFTGDKAGRTLNKSVVTTDKSGFATFEFTAPHDAQLTLVNVGVEGKLANLHPRIDQGFRVESAESMSLTSDKPLYQPGQTVHLRLLALDRTGEARKGEKVTLDVRDPENTLVFRTEATTSAFGIASADWTTAQRLRLGSYSINAESEGDRNGYLQVRLSRYDLPTFTVEPKPDKPYYLPGQNAVVKVRGLYLFGKPVAKGHVRVVRESQRRWDFQKQKYDSTEGAVVEGELGADGSFDAKLDLKEEQKDFADDGDSDRKFKDVSLAAYLTDRSTGRTEQRRFDVRVTASPLHVYVVRDTSTPVGLALGFAVTVSTAEGKPAAGAEVRILQLPELGKGSKETLTERLARALELKIVRVNEFGVARVDGLPVWEKLATAKAGEVDLMAVARLPDGRMGRVTADINEPDKTLRVRTDWSLYKPGEPVRVTVESAREGLPVTVELFRPMRTGLMPLFTENVVVRGGRAQVQVNTGTPEAPDPRFAGLIAIGAVDLSAVPSGYGEQPGLATRTVLFPRDNALHVAVKMGRDDYRPGEMASASVAVTGPGDPDGEAPGGIERVALGVAAVDQAVMERNRADTNFGGGGGSFFFPYRGVQFYGRSVAGLSLADLQALPAEKPFPPGLDLAASVILNANEEPLRVTDDRPNRDLGSVFCNEMQRTLGPVREALGEYLKTSPDAPTTAAGLDALLAGKGLSVSALRDPWGMPYRVEASISDRFLYLQLMSAGPDKQAGTQDDFRLPLVGWEWFGRQQRELKRALMVDHAKTKTFVRDLPALRAAAARQGIDLDAWRDAWGQPLTWRFSIDQADYGVTAISHGAAGQADEVDFELGTIEQPWFSDNRLRVQEALSDYSRTHPFPTNNAELAAAGVRLDALRDPWGHALYASFRQRSIFTDRVTVEARAHAGETPKQKLHITPVTEVLDTLDLKSMGPDGIPVNDDDFVVATLSHVRSQQAAKDAAAAAGKGSTVQGGDPIVTSGGVLGTVSDSSGAVIPNVKVMAKREGTGEEFEGATDEDGEYGFAELPAGRYTLQFAAPGFQTTVIDQVQVQPPDATLLDVKLSVGSVGETVEVLAGSVMLETSSASVGITAGMPGMGGRLRDKVPMPMMAAPPPPPAPGATSTPRLREYFPETLLWRPEVLTSSDGQATLRFPVADSITAWQVSVAASTLHGNTGGGQASFVTTLSFFAALDPPQVLTVGDKLSLPVTLRNYLDHAVTVRSETAPAPWLRVTKDAGVTEVAAQASESPVVEMAAVAPDRAAKLEFTARPNGAAGDRIEKPLLVHPDGQEFAVTAAGVVRGNATFALDVPADALATGGDLMVKVYPNLAAHLRDALVAMAQYPAGCAEQTISSAWPSLLLLQYQAGLPAARRKIPAEARRNLEEAYANLLGARLDGGFGYWAGDGRADLALTAYAVQFLTAAKVYIAVDDEVLKQAVQSLAKAQEPGGLWVRVSRDGKKHAEDANGNAMLTASIAAMLVGAPDAQLVISKAAAAVGPFAESVDEPYTVAGYLLALKDPGAKATTVARLRKMALSEDGGAYWALETNTPFFGWGRAGRVETTAMVMRALLSAGVPADDALVGKSLLWLERQQDRQSLWYSTQASARVLDVLAAIALRGPAAGAGGKGVVRVDGEVVGSMTIPAAEVDAGPVMLALPKTLAVGKHSVAMELGSTSTAQVVATVYRPWGLAPDSVTNNERLSMTVLFDHPDAVPGELVEATAHVERAGFRGYGMLIAEVGLPPGADVDRASLEAAMTASGFAINHYDVLPDRVLFYLWPRAGGTELKFGLRMRYRVEALSAGSVVYDYYNPDARFVVGPVRFGGGR